MYHVVCHDCTFERITDDGQEAAGWKSHHSVAEAHDVEYAEVGDVE